MTDIFKKGEGDFVVVALGPEKWVAPRPPQEVWKSTKIEAKRLPRSNDEGIQAQNLENLKNDDTLNENTWFWGSGRDWKSSNAGRKQFQKQEKEKSQQH